MELRSCSNCFTKRLVKSNNAFEADGIQPSRPTLTAAAQLGRYAKDMNLPDLPENIGKTVTLKVPQNGERLTAEIADEIRRH